MRYAVDFGNGATNTYDSDQYAALQTAGLFDGLTVTEIVEPLTVDDVRAECSRRMQVLVGARDAGHLAMIIQNANREATRLQAIRIGVPGVVTGRDWTEQEAQRAAALYLADAAIEALRAASNVLEAMDPIPADYASDSRWP